MAKSYLEGQEPRFIATFRDAADALIDPDQVFFSVLKPDATVETYQYGVDIEVMRDSLGVYHVDYSLIDMVAGTYRYRWHSTGNGQAAEEKTFTVRASTVI